VALFELAEKQPWIVAAFLLFGFVLFAMAMRPRPENRRRLLLVDDDADVRRAFKMLIEARTNFEVIAEASTGDAALKAVAAVEPEVVVMDVSLPVVDGRTAAMEIKRYFPETIIVGFSSPDDDATGSIMLNAGADAYLVKGDSPERIVAVLDGLARVDA
jgi:DNA-binding NarL/FixJ family response regulator